MPEDSTIVRTVYRSFKMLYMFMLVNYKLSSHFNKINWYNLAFIILMNVQTTICYSDFPIILVHVFKKLLKEILNRFTGILDFHLQQIKVVKYKV